MPIPTPLIELDADAIADRVFSARADLPDDVERIPLKLVHANRVAALAPLSVLAGVDLARIGLDPPRCLRHLERLQRVPILPTQTAAGVRESLRRRETLIRELALYSGFLQDADKPLLRDVRGTQPAQLAARRFAFRDRRLTELFCALSRTQLARTSRSRRSRALASLLSRPSSNARPNSPALTFDDYFGADRKPARRIGTATHAAVIRYEHRYGRTPARDGRLNSPIPESHMTAYFHRQLSRSHAISPRNNNRDWFATNKARYEKQLREPFLRLLDDLQAPLTKISTHYRADTRTQGGSLFRQHRDTRSANDKTPYKTWTGARLFHECSRHRSAGVLYAHPTR